MKHSPYLSTALEDLAWTVDKAREKLDGIGFDAIVCTGVSGMLVGPALALAMRKKICIVRKPDDHQNHAMARIESGMETDDRWIFVDDLICSGGTEQRVSSIMNKGGYGFSSGTYLYNDATFSRGEI